MGGAKTNPGRGEGVAVIAMLAVAVTCVWPAPVAASQAREAAPPPRAQCARLANIDWRRFERERRRSAHQRLPDADQRILAALSRAAVPADADHRPPADAAIVIRVHIPPYHHYRIEDWAVAWREDDGQWWFWRQRYDWGAPTPPPPPPPSGLRPGETWQTPQPPTMDERFPPTSGLLNPRDAAFMEEAWADPCRVWEPTGAASPLPLRRPEGDDPRRERWCPHGASPIMGEITERGQAPRLFFYPCDMDFSSRILLTGAAYATAPSGD